MVSKSPSFQSDSAFFLVGGKKILLCLTERMSANYPFIICLNFGNMWLWRLNLL